MLAIGKIAKNAVQLNVLKSTKRRESKQIVNRVANVYHCHRVGKL